MVKRTIRRKVQKVIDGDTVKVAKKVSGSQYIRIAGVNAPEKRQKGYATAKRKLAKKIEGRVLTLKPVAKSYGRTVAEVPFVKRKAKKKRKRR